MKKLFSLIFISLATFLLFSCAGGNKIGYDSFEYGRYPQEIVSSKEIIDKLNTFTDTDVNADGYLVLDNVEYEKVVATPFVDGELYFSDNTTIRNGKVYYFKVKSIKWRVIEAKDNTKVAITDQILDVTEYPTYIVKNQDEVAKGAEPIKEMKSVKYNESNLREFLNNDFYKLAFSNEDKEPKATKVEVANISGDNPKYVEDKVWIPSYKEINLNSFQSDDDRYAFATDYAKAVGVDCFFDSPNSYYYNASPYPLRTLSIASTASIFYVNYYGKVTSVSNDNYYKSVSVRPCITL